MDQSSLLRIQMNSAESNAEQARTAYISSLPVAEQASYFMDTVGPRIDTASREAQQLQQIDRFVLSVLERETGSIGSLDSVKEMTDKEISKMEEEIEHLKTQIRMERRLFLDAQPSVSPSVAGTYFLQVPDNRLLLAFMITTAIFLSLISIGIFLGLFPIPRLEATTVRERIFLIAGLWSATILIVYLGLYSFT